ncbi:MAG: hypothetical protein KIC54_01275 [Clostridium sp.]|nr:hypothetical protein [Clostridium sp.]
MEILDKIFCWINSNIKNVQSHSKDSRNTELILAYYNGYETALKEMKKEVVKIKQEKEGGISMEVENKEIAIKGIALLLKEKAVGIKEICDEIKVDGKVYDSEIISLNTVTENMKTIIGSLEACKNLSNENNTKDNSINEQKEKE